MRLAGMWVVRVSFRDFDVLDGYGAEAWRREVGLGWRRLQPQAAKFSAGCATELLWHLCVVFQPVESSTPVPSPPSSENTPPGLPTASVTMGQYYNLFGQKVASQYVSAPPKQ